MTSALFRSPFSEHTFRAQCSREPELIDFFLGYSLRYEKSFESALTVFFGLAIFSVGCVEPRAVRQVFACDLVTYTQPALPGREEEGV